MLIEREALKTGERKGIRQKGTQNLDGEGSVRCLSVSNQGNGEQQWGMRGSLQVSGVRLREWLSDHLV